MTTREVMAWNGVVGIIDRPLPTLRGGALNTTAAAPGPMAEGLRLVAVGQRRDPAIR
jgi:hypothetical protein